MRIAIVDKNKFAHYSYHARSQLSRGGSKGSILPTGSVTIPGTQAEGEGMEKALVKVLRWVDGNDIKSSQPLTANVLGVEEFPDVV